MKTKIILLISILFLSVPVFSQQIGDGYAVVLPDFTVPLNSGAYNGLNPTGSVPDNSFGGWQHLLVIRHPNPNNNHQLQIGTSFTQNDRLFYRKVVGDLNPNNPNWIELATRGENSFIGNQSISGNIGVGTTAGNSKLVIAEGVDALSMNAGTVNGLGFNRNVLDGAIFNSSKSAWQFSARDERFTLEGYNGAVPELFSISKNGNFGIGTISPEAKLDVNGAIFSRGTEAIRLISDNSYLSGYDNTNTTRNGYLQINNGSINFQSETGNRYMLLNANGGNVGIGTNNPQNTLQIGEFNTNTTSKLSIPGVYNFEEIKLGQYGNGRSGLEMITHAGQTQSFGVRLFSGTDTGVNGLLVQTADPANLEQNLTYTTQMVVKLNGNVGIGETNPNNKLDVKGTIHSKEVKVDMTGWSDFVFKKGYDLPTLAEVEKQIAEKGHLANIPSEEEVLKNGINLGEMNSKLLQKIEELTLYTIEQEKKNNIQSQKIEALEKENLAFKSLSERLSKLENQSK